MNLHFLSRHFLFIICGITASSYAQQASYRDFESTQLKQPFDMLVAKNYALLQSKKQRSFPSWLLGREPVSPEVMSNIISHCPERIIRFIENINRKLSHGDKEVQAKLLLMGNLGSGKSSMAKTIAAKCGLPFFLYNAGHLKNEYQNSGHRSVEILLAQALHHGRPSVLIIEKIEFLFNETTPDCRSNIAMLKQILDVVAQYPVILICTYNKDACNLPEEVADRFKLSMVNIPLPDYNQRIQLIEYFLKGTSKKPSKDFSLKAIASKTQGFSARRLCELLEVAAYFYSENNEITTKSCLRTLQGNQNREPWYLRLKSLPWPLIAAYIAAGLNLYYGYKYYKALQRYQ